MAVSFIGEEIHRPAASHWQTLSHNYVASSTPYLSGIQLTLLVIALITQVVINTTEWIICFKSNKQYLIEFQILSNSITIDATIGELDDT
jgi:hypothetical protein